MNYGSIRINLTETECWVFALTFLNQLRYYSTPLDTQINVGCFIQRSEMKYGSIRIHLTQKRMSGACYNVPKSITVLFDSTGCILKYMLDVFFNGPK